MIFLVKRIEMEKVKGTFLYLFSFKLTPALTNMRDLREEEIHGNTIHPVRFSANHQE